MSEWRTRITKVQVVKPTSRTGEACLVLLYPPGHDMGKRFPLNRSEVVLGRGADCDIQVDRDSVSRRHARIFRAGDDWLVEDLQSTNGSYVNDVPINRSILHDEDFVKIGAAIFRFLAGSGIEASYHEEIYKLTIIDALTSAYNKRYFFEFWQREIFRCARYGRPLSLIMFDIDHFKSLNDKHGHITGDFVLRGISGRILPRIRPEELLARYGGEEFAIVLPEHDLTSAGMFGEQVRRLVADEPFEYEGDTFQVSVSVGVACNEGKAMDRRPLALTVPLDAPAAPSPLEEEPVHGLYFQGPDGRAQLVSTSALEETFGAAGASVKLVVLSACYSERQAESLLAHVGCVVGVSGAIREGAARNFAIGFYGGLGERESVAAAYKQGLAAISLEGLRDGDRPQLKVRADVNAARLVLAATPS